MATKSPTRLTETLIRKLEYVDRPFTVRDTKITGLMVAVNKRSKSYKVQRDLWQGQRGRRKFVKTVRHTLGTVEELTLDDARVQASEVLARIVRGEDPNAPDAQAEASARTWTTEEMYQEYAADMRARECAERSVTDMLDRLDRYLADWKPLPISAIKKSTARERHQRITRDHGKRVANQALKDFSRAYNFALRVEDDPDALGDNPVKAVTFNKERASNRVLMPDDLADWWSAVQELPSPTRRAMHELGILSGLRPGTLVSLRGEWVNLEDRCISIPKMKSGRSFDLPLSARMVSVVRRALDLGDMLFPGAPWLFPSRSRVTGEVIATQVWKEKTLPSQTGHILRHTYRTLAQRAGVDPIYARLLLDHAVPGIDGVYIHNTALFEPMLEAQEKMTETIGALLEPEETLAKAAA